jgi:hypothetical protein
MIDGLRPQLSSLPGTPPTRPRGASRPGQGREAVS